MSFFPDKKCLLVIIDPYDKEVMAEAMRFLREEYNVHDKDELLFVEIEGRTCVYRKKDVVL